MKEIYKFQILIEDLINDIAVVSSSIILQLEKLTDDKKYVINVTAVDCNNEISLNRISIINFSVTTDKLYIEEIKTKINKIMEIEKIYYKINKISYKEV